MGKYILIETDNLILRHFSADDAGKVLQMSREEGLRRWIPDQVYKDEAESARVIKFLIEQYPAEPAPQTKPLVLGVELKQTGELIGHVGFSPAENSVEIGYAIEEKLQGKGYATEAVRAMSGWAVGELGLPEILGIVAGGNAKSCRVLEKAGYSLVEEKEKIMLGNCRLCKVYRYSLPGFGAVGRD
ncbi:MAG: GNAT family N-acetyltransferase [Candidatus Edwardsbacteria bacterium]|nr:GNAT family N-acetyltransferase [Candidatus Edwardsbacteria bacterium]